MIRLEQKQYSDFGAEIVGMATLKAPEETVRPFSYTPQAFGQLPMLATLNPVIETVRPINSQPVVIQPLTVRPPIVDEIKQALSNAVLTPSGTSVQGDCFKAPAIVNQFAIKCEDFLKREIILTSAAQMRVELVQARVIKLECLQLQAAVSKCIQVAANSAREAYNRVMSTPRYNSFFRRYMMPSDPEYGEPSLYQDYRRWDDLFNSLNSASSQLQSFTQRIDQANIILTKKIGEFAVKLGYDSSSPFELAARAIIIRNRVKALEESKPDLDKLNDDLAKATEELSQITLESVIKKIEAERALDAAQKTIILPPGFNEFLAKSVIISEQNLAKNKIAEIEANIKNAKKVLDEIAAYNTEAEKIAASLKLLEPVEPIKTAEIKKVVTNYAHPLARKSVASSPMGLVFIAPAPKGTPEYDKALADFQRIEAAWSGGIADRFAENWAKMTPEEQKKASQRGGASLFDFVGPLIAVAATIVSGGTLGAAFIVAAKTAATKAVADILKNTPIGNIAVLGDLIKVGSSAISGDFSVVVDTLYQTGKKFAVDEATKANKYLGILTGGVVEGKSFSDIISESADTATQENPAVKLAVKAILNGEIPSTPELKAQALMIAAQDEAKKLSLDFLSKDLKLDLNIVSKIAGGADPASLEVSPETAKIIKNTLSSSSNIALQQIEDVAGFQTGASKELINAVSGEALKTASDILAEVDQVELKMGQFSNASIQAILSNNASSLGVKILKSPVTSLSPAQREKNANALLEKAKPALAEAAGKVTNLSNQIKEARTKIDSAAKEIDSLSVVLGSATEAGKAFLQDRLDLIQTMIPLLKDFLVSLNGQANQALKDFDKIRLTEGLKVAAAREGRYWDGMSYAHPFVIWGLI